MILAMLCFLCAGNVDAQSGGAFPPEPFNGMQINYQIAGATITGVEDSPGMTWGRTLTISGIQSGGNLTVSGMLNANSGYFADVVVTVTAGGKSESLKYKIYPDKPQAFSVSVPIPNNAKAAGISIVMDGSFNAGGRGVVVSGSWERAEEAPSPVAAPSTDAGVAGSVPGAGGVTVPAADNSVIWSVVVGLGVGAVAMAAIVAALKKKALTQAVVRPPQTSGPTEKETEQKPPEAYVLQVSADQLVLSEGSPAALTASVWKVDLATTSQQLAQDAVIELAGLSQIPELAVTQESTPGRLACQFSLTAPSSVSGAVLQVLAQAGGSQYSAQVTMTIQQSFRLEFF